MVHVPSHVGLRGNEIADRQAALGPTNPTVPDKPPFALPPSLAQWKKRLATATLTASVQRRTALQNTSDSIRWHALSTRDLPPVPPRLCRRDQVTLHRLRLGYRCNWEISHRTDRDCAHCLRTTDLPLIHYVIECPKTRDAFGTRHETDCDNAHELAATAHQHIRST